MIYVFDTNSLSALNGYYPNVFKSFWSQFNATVHGGDIISTREVRAELNRSGLPNVLAWANAHSAVFTTPNAAEQAFVAAILAVPHFQSLIGSKAVLNGTPVADPFVIACARVNGGTVVTEEKLKPGAAKIPNVCVHFSVAWTNLEGFLSAMGWSF